MLSLMSSVSERLTGTRSFVNWVIGCAHAVFFDGEVVLAERGDQAAFAVAHRHRGAHELRGGAEVVLAAQVDRPLPFDSRPTALGGRLLAQGKRQ